MAVYIPPYAIKLCALYPGFQTVSRPIKIHKRLEQMSPARQRLVNGNLIFMLNISLLLTLGKCLTCLIFLRIVISFGFSSLVLFPSMFSSVSLLFVCHIMIFSLSAKIILVFNETLAYLRLKHIQVY